MTSGADRVWGPGNSECLGAAMWGLWAPLKEKAWPCPSAHLTGGLALGIVPKGSDKRQTGASWQKVGAKVKKPARTSFLQDAL